MVARARGLGPAARARRLQCDPLQPTTKEEFMMPSKRWTMVVLISQPSLHRAPCSAVVTGSWSHAASQSSRCARLHSVAVVDAVLQRVAAR
eukprot:9165460-Pyramimonas_sp.AAC.2